MKSERVIGELDFFVEVLSVCEDMVRSIDDRECRSDSSHRHYSAKSHDRQLVNSHHNIYLLQNLL